MKNNESLKRLLQILTLKRSLNGTQTVNMDLDDLLKRYFDSVILNRTDSSFDDKRVPKIPFPNATSFNFDYSNHFGEAPWRTALLILAYVVIIVVSLFGNILVCHVVIRHRRLHTLTNTFLANLALSDLLMTALNIPFSLAHILLEDWPFGSFMCCLVPWVQVTSVYVSSLSMSCIAMDRYRVIMHPMKRRLGSVHGAVLIALVWLVSACMALPYAIYHRVEEVQTFRLLNRCFAEYPDPSDEFRRWLTLETLITQYLAPLCVTAGAYIAITRRLWMHTIPGAPTESQLLRQTRNKRRSIKMLVVVVAMFALCWLPYNIYHMCADFNIFLPNSTTFFACHWIAMSSVCYNPFLYFWLNEHFRVAAMRWLRCPCIPRTSVHPGVEINGILVRLDKIRRNNEPSSSSAMRFRDSVQQQRSSPRTMGTGFGQRQEIPMSSLACQANGHAGNITRNSRNIFMASNL